MDHALLPALTRIAEALDRLSPPAAASPSLKGADAFVWHPSPRPRLQPVRRVAAVGIGLLQGIDRQKDILVENTLRFARGLPANNVMLWGARGMGKSSLVKAAHAAANQAVPGSLALIEIHREDIRTLPDLLNILREQPRRALVFCDDLSFEKDDADYKALKSVLDGGIEGRPANVLFYATSNRRHLMARDMIENERSTAISPGEAVEEKVSLSDRFGLWIGFHNCDGPTYHAMVAGYVAALGIAVDPETLRREANEWQVTRGSRSGRVAWQFVTDLAGRHGVALPG
ncbi:ATP-binding protein [Roseomonas sp. NAR14]|uniref:ATP-binding protein n=1 Tax=Roseomonas acroporae TaxID=2937791 RepID=A0A9X1Y3Z8_9PROT|nr:ATP-binding protein [Roseomonas acroporae]MCK8783769.1 ATP-binding protein [Roseomonas acroporae]